MGKGEKKINFPNYIAQNSIDQALFQQYQREKRKKIIKYVYTHICHEKQ